MVFMPYLGDGQGEDAALVPSSIAITEAPKSVIITGLKLDVWTIFCLVVAVSVSQAIIFGLAVVILHALGVF